MEAWIIYGSKEAKKNSHYIDLYREEGKQRGITFRLLLTENMTMGCDERGCYLLYEGVRQENPDFAIVRVIYPLLSFHLEEMGIPIYNSSRVACLCNDKARTYQFLAARGIRCVPTVFGRHEEVTEKCSELEKCGVHLSEMVVKTVDGHGGSQVFLASDRENIEKKSGHSSFVIQPKIHGKGQDIRVYIIGNEIVAAVCRSATKDFRANFSLGGKVRLYELSEEERKLVNQITRLFSFGMVGIDFIVDDEGRFLLNEIEDVVGARMLYQCSNINLVGRYLDYIVTDLSKTKVLVK